MNYFKILENSKTEKIKISTLLIYLLQNFNNLGLESFQESFKGKILEVTGNKDVIGAQDLIPGVDTCSFIFYEDVAHVGNLDLDFYHGSVANIRFQIFLNFPLLSGKLVDKNYEQIEYLLTKLFGEKEDVGLFNQFKWEDVERNLVITLRKDKEMKFISFAITKKEYF
jgi:hypothetical protein